LEKKAASHRRRKSYRCREAGLRADEVLENSANRRMPKVQAVKP